jgi:uncharacterized protein YkwD
MKKFCLLSFLLMGFKERPLEISIDDFYDEINRVRVERKLNTCLPGLYLEQAANRHASDMQMHDFLSHTGSDGSTYITRVRAAGGMFTPSGEIIAKGPGGKNAIKNVVAAWLESEGHAKILLDPRNSFCGAAYRLKNNEYKGNYWVVVFSYRI